MNGLADVVRTVEPDLLPRRQSTAQLLGRSKERQMTSQPGNRVELAMFYLQTAVLDVLLTARRTGGTCLGPAAIGGLTGIYQDSGPRVNMNDAIVHGVLNRLHWQGRVERCTQTNGRGGWRITDDEFARCQDDA